MCCFYNELFVIDNNDPNRSMRLFATQNPIVLTIIAPLGRNKEACNEKAKKLPDWQPCNHEDVILAAAER
jgi:hypothetical protein